MRFQPKTEAEIEAAGLWPKGAYDFAVRDAADKVSEKGNDMIELDVEVVNGDGETRTVKDWLVATDASAYKIRHFARATGMMDAYQRGELKAKAMIGKTGRCQIGIKKDKGGQFRDKNGIIDYIDPAESGDAPAPRPKAPARTPAPSGGDFDDDDEIPF